MNQNDYNDFNEGLLDLIEKHQNDFEPPEAVFIGIQFFSKMAFDMAPDAKSAREAINLGIDSALEGSVKELTND
mgnify:CR=1 FL=1|tara:strand:+ start:183 stop:404 length:222 start_codon:yes stop_codon:yes gene_type:complete